MCTLLTGWQVNYSISLGLGFASTVEVHTNNGGRTFEDILLGYRAALYMGVGLAGLGVLVAIMFVFKRNRDQSGRQHSEKAKSGA
jgi:mannose/fructose/N-acetylgalactosamine-specific phosphotransferase system component IIC